MAGAVKLSLYIGPGVPIPAPPEVLELLASAKVMSGAGESQSGFELSFDLPPRSPLRTLFLLTGGGNLPLMRVTLVVTINGQAESIIDGMTTDVEMQPGEGGIGRLVVKGKDMSALMDVIDFTGLPYPAMPPSARVLILLAKYAAVGVIPIVIPSIVEDIPIPVQRMPVQRGSDYQYIKRLAQQCGHVFYLEPGPAPGASKAYWGPEVRVGAPQPALSMNMDALTNVEELSFNFDRERKTMPIVYFQESVSKAPIGVPIPDISPLNPPLGVVPPLPPKIVNLDDTAHMSAPAALMTGLAYASQHSDSVFGTGRLDVARYGRLLKSRALVGVRGAGLPFDGLHYVSSVTHDIQRGQYKQSFTLARNALISTIPKVPV
jgi:hypothetical protein